MNEYTFKDKYGLIKIVIAKNKWQAMRKARRLAGNSFIIPIMTCVI
jgi:hypothetical protein